MFSGLAAAVLGTLQLLGGTAVYENQPAKAPASPLVVVETTSTAASSTTPHVPFFSQFKNISDPEWRGGGCGITSLAMVIDYYRPGATDVDALLAQGIAADAYIPHVGWIYQSLIDLAKPFGLSGVYYDLTNVSSDTAFERFKTYVAQGPVILVVHYRFDPTSTIPHLVVINAIDEERVYYNDPAAKRGDLSIPLSDFLKGWKRKVIAIRPAD